MKRTTLRKTTAVTIFATITRRILVPPKVVLEGSRKNDADAVKAWRGSEVRAKTEI
jgi:hypothetical protein